MGTFVFTYLGRGRAEDMFDVRRCACPPTRLEPGLWVAPDRPAGEDISPQGRFSIKLRADHRQILMGIHERLELGAPGRKPRTFVGPFRSRPSVFC